jgi:hypothetical protein
MPSVADVVELPQGLVINGKLIKRDELPELILKAVKVLERTK